MANFTGNPDSGSGDYFAGLFVPGPSFVFSVTFSAISVPLIIGVLYSGKNHSSRTKLDNLTFYYYFFIWRIEQIG
jgi:hypothetical protein